MELEKELHFTVDWVTWRSDLWLKVLDRFQAKPDIKYLEIGSYEGKSVIWMMQNILSHPTSKADIVDSFMFKTEALFRNNLNLSKVSDRVKVHVGGSHLLTRTFIPHNYEIIYIDGCHCSRHILTDAILCWDLLKVGGVMIFDDYLYKDFTPDQASPQVTCDFFVEIFKEEMNVLYKGYELILEKKKNIHSYDYPKLNSSDRLLLRYTSSGLLLIKLIKSKIAYKIRRLLRMI